MFITNPLCKMCFEAHKIYTKLLEKYPNGQEIKIRFLVLNKNREDLRTQISECLLQFYEKEKLDFFKDALDDWYKERNATKSLKKWIMKPVDGKYNKIIEEQIKWCLQNEIVSTP